LIFALALALLAGAGLLLFKNYAWINETAFISFAVAILVTSIIGIVRWGEMDEPYDRTTGRPMRRATVAATPMPAPAEEPLVAPTVRRKPKPRPRKPAPRKR
jgi:hypothetical protein